MTTSKIKERNRRGKTQRSYLMDDAPWMPLENKAVPGDTCECGHVRDEHEGAGGPCTVDECHCIQFERTG